MDKLAKYNRGVQYLRVAVDCLSRYLRVEPLKTKYAEGTAEALRKKIKPKQPKKIWTDKGTEFQGEFEKLCTEREIVKHNTHSEKKLAFAERNIRLIKNIIDEYLKFEWTNCYIEKPQSFVQTINSRVTRVTKLAPTMATRKHVPVLVSIIAKTDLRFREGCKLIFTDEIFEIVAIAKVNPPTYNLIDAEKEEINGNFFEKKKLDLIGNKAHLDKDGQ